MKKFSAYKNLKVCVALFAALAVAAVSAAMPESISAGANSGPTSWHGVTASGTVFTDENCPVEVESEALTFNVPKFIDHSSEKEDYLDYNANFSAEYTFKNPTQNAVKATLAFPLGEHSHFGYWENGESNPDDKYIYLEDLLAEKGMYKVLKNGEPIEAQTRYTFHVLNEFDFSKESKQLCNGYREHEFFRRDMPVYIYSFRFVSEEKDYFNAEATISGTDGLRFGGDYGSTEKGKNKTTLTFSVRGGDEVNLYSIGGEIADGAISWDFYKISGYFGLNIKRVKAVAVPSPNVETTTFEDYVFKGYSWGNEVSETEKYDFYNAVLDYIDEYLETSMLPKGYTFLKGSSYLMRWMVYDLDFSAGETVKNTVSAPLFSGGLYKYTPSVYTYEYLLSPAQNWSGFKSLEIRINTPYYLIGSSLHFEKTDYGYVYTADGLPEDELTFDMCTVEDPVKSKSGGGYVAFAVVLTIIAVLAILVPVTGIIIFIVCLVKSSKRGRNESVGGKGRKDGGGANGGSDGKKSGGSADGNGFTPNNFIDGNGTNRF